jgi:ABC-type sugar transport system substrate-binding protein
MAVRRRVASDGRTAGEVETHFRESRRDSQVPPMGDGQFPLLFIELCGRATKALSPDNLRSMILLSNPMKKMSVLVALTTDDNDYQIEQAASAEEAARRHGFELKIVYADNDAIHQSQQLLQVIQSSGAKPDAIVFEPAGSTSLPQVARAAASSGIGWVILNREADYTSNLRHTYKVPVFAITSDHEEIGRIQGRQIGALLPQGGSVIYIQGPSGSDAAQQRTEGMQQAKPANVQVRTLRAQWTEGSAHQAVSAWLRLSTSRELRIDAVVAQDDSMAVGAKKAFQEIPDLEQRKRWLAAPFTGCDGLPKTGQAWVRGGQLAATVIVPPNTGLAIDMLAKAAQSGTLPPERTYTETRSFPSLEELQSKRPR